MDKKKIKELLPEPKLVDNPYYRKAAKMKLWDIKVVKQKERTKKFKEYAESKEKRSEKMKEVAERKKNETLKQIEEFDFQVERLEIEELKKLYRKIGKVQAYINYKEILTEKIFQVYPVKVEGLHII